MDEDDSEWGDHENIVLDEEEDFDDNIHETHSEAWRPHLHSKESLDAA